MSKLTWDTLTDKHYQAGVDRCVYFDDSGRGHAWPGLISVVEQNSEASSSNVYLDGIKLTNRKRFGDFSAAIEAFTYPKVLDARPKKSFAFTYRVMTDDGYQIHIVYNAVATVSDTQRVSMSGDTDLSLLKFNVTTLKHVFDDVYATSHLIVNTRNTGALTELESRLYGNDEDDSHLPAFEDLVNIFEAHATIRVTDNHDGSFTITGPDELVYLTSPTTFEVISDGITWLDTDTYRIKST